jgi:hypothetical protein
VLFLPSRHQGEHVGSLLRIMLLTDSTSWAQYLRDYDRAANILKNCGIFDKAQRSGAIGLSSQIERALMAPFASTVPEQANGRWTLSMPLQLPLYRPKEPSRT